MKVDAGRAIGIFDSGVGGLTVYRRVVERLRGESVVYLGDTARVPYGTKSPETVERYARNCAAILERYGVKLLIVACNTASAFALDALRDDLDIPVMGVVEPGAQWAVKQTRNRRIGVIGTAGTIASGAYQRAISRYASDVTIFCAACPLLAPLAEEGWTTGPVPVSVVRHYLTDLLAQDIDTLVLGCTHYPLLKSVIGEVAGPGVTLVDSAEATSEAADETLRGLGLLRDFATPPERRFLVTDGPDAFARVGALFLGEALLSVTWVDV